MSDEQAREDYAAARLGESVTVGSRPAVLVVDFSCGFTDPECTLGSDMTGAVEATKRLLDAVRAKGLPVVFTTIGFEPSLKDGGLWLQKVPSLGDLQVGGKWVEIDPKYFRPAEVDLLIGDYSKAKAKLGWEPKTKFKALIELMVEADLRLLHDQLAGKPILSY